MFRRYSFYFVFIDICWLMKRDLSQSETEKYHTIIPRREGEYWWWYRDAKRRGIYLALWNDPEGDSWFSIYQISWIKIKIKIFVNKRRQLDKVCLRFNSLCSWDHFLWFCCKFSKKIIFYLPVNTHKKKVRRFLGIFFCTTASFIAQIKSHGSCSNKCLETRRHLGSGRKTMNS